MRLNEIPAGRRVFIDANIFIYHFTGASRECLEFFKRCETKDLTGITGLMVLAEVCHQLMIAEAISRSLISPARPVRQLQKRPEIVKQLHVYTGQMSSLLSWGLEIIHPGEQLMAESQLFRSRYGLLTNDSFIPACMRKANTGLLASNDQVFQQIPGLQVYAPADC